MQSERARPRDAARGTSVGAKDETAEAVLEVEDHVGLLGRELINVQQVPLRFAPAGSCLARCPLRNSKQKI